MLFYSPTRQLASSLKTATGCFLNVRRCLF